MVVPLTVLLFACGWKSERGECTPTPTGSALTPPSPPSSPTPFLPLYTVTAQMYGNLIWKDNCGKSKVRVLQFTAVWFKWYCDEWSWSVKSWMHFHQVQTICCIMGLDDDWSSKSIAILLQDTVSNFIMTIMGWWKHMFSLFITIFYDYSNE